MSLSQGLPLYLSSAANIGTRIKGPAHAGQIADNAGGPIPAPGGFICVQSTASVTNQVVTTSATGLQNASFMYVPVTTGSLVGAGAPPFLGCGTPIVWNDGLKTLNIWSSGAQSWLVLITSSGGAAGFSSSG